MLEQSKLQSKYYGQHAEFTVFSNKLPYISTSPLGKISETFIDYKKVKYDRSYLEMAKIWAKNSHCTRLQVGCLLVKNSMIISDGFNGLPSGYQDEDGNTCNKCEKDNNTRWEVLHAESNALMKLASYGRETSKGATVYVTTTPCSDCSKLLVQARVSRVIFSSLYRDLKGLQLLLNSGIELMYYKKI